MSLGQARGKAKEAAYASASQNVSARVAAQTYGVKTNSVYHAARRCGLTLPSGKKGSAR